MNDFIMFCAACSLAACGPVASEEYESNMGTQYQYDLWDPADSSEYETDLDAQMNDQLSIDVQIDRGLEDYRGGGVEDGQ